MSISHAYCTVLTQPLFHPLNIISLETQIPRNIMKYVLQAAAALSAGTFAFVKAQAGDNETKGTTRGALAVAGSSAIAAPVTSELKSVRRLYSDCNACHVSGRELGDTGSNITALPGSYHNTCIMNDGQFVMPTKEALDACCDRKMTSTGEKWNVDSFVEFLKNDADHNTLVQEGGRPIAELLKSICDVGVANDGAGYTDLIDEAIAASQEGESTSTKDSSTSGGVAKNSGNFGAGLALFSTVALLELAKRK